MWGVPKGSEVANSKKLQALFGVAGPVEVGRIYGSIADGTARVLYNPRSPIPGSTSPRPASDAPSNGFRRR